VHIPGFVGGPGGRGGLKDKEARAGRLRQEMTMKLKLDCQTIQQGYGGFPGQPATRSAKKTKICGYAGPLYSVNALRCDVADMGAG